MAEEEPFKEDKMTMIGHVVFPNGNKVETLDRYLDGLRKAIKEGGPDFSMVVYDKYALTAHYHACVEAGWTPLELAEAICRVRRET